MTKKENRSIRKLKKEYDYCFYKSENEHIHVKCRYNGKKYEIVAAWNAENEILPSYPYRLTDGDYDAVNRFLEEY